MNGTKSDRFKSLLRRREVFTNEYEEAVRDIRPATSSQDENGTHDRTASTVSSDTTLSADKRSTSPPDRSISPRSPVANESPEPKAIETPQITIAENQKTTTNGHSESAPHPANPSTPPTSTLSVPSKRPSQASSGSNRSIFRSPMDASNTSDASFSSEETESDEEPPVVVARPQPPAMANAVRPVYPTVALPPRQQLPTNGAAPIQPPTQFVGPTRPNTNVPLQKPAVIVQPPPPRFVPGATPVLQAPQLPTQTPEKKSVQQKVVVETVSEADSSSDSDHPSPLRAVPKIADANNLPKIYTHRNTTRSIYRSLPINAWTSKDILDFLFDQKLYAMMPLCELMSGPAFIRFYQMSQEASNQLFEHLSKELSTRFNGLVLPSSVYSQFLTVLNSLLGKPADAAPTNPPARQKIIERVVLKPINPPTEQTVDTASR